MIYTEPQAHACKRCNRTQLTGKAQVCEACLEKATRCGDCGAPHGGGPLTKYCPPCRANRRRKPTKLGPFTSEQDQQIRDAYQEHHGTKALAILMKRLNRPRWSISRRAQVIGASTVRRKEPRWSPDEIEILREWAWMVPERIRLKLKAAGFQRTTTAIAVQRKRLRLASTVDGHNASELAELLGIDAKTVTRWVQRGWLKARRCGTTRDNHDQYHITTDCFRAFLLAHHEHVDLGKAERAGSKLWLLDLLTNGAGVFSHNQDDEAVATPPPESPLADEALHARARADLRAQAVGHVQALMAARGMTTKRLARRLGMAASELDALLTGRAPLHIDRLASLVAELGGRLEVTVSPLDAA